MVSGAVTHWRETVDREVLRFKGRGVCDVTPWARSMCRVTMQLFLKPCVCQRFLKLPVGKTRYGLMLREDGIAMDDGLRRA